jgi:hypothetical protein
MCYPISNQRYGDGFVRNDWQVAERLCTSIVSQSGGVAGCWPRDIMTKNFCLGTCSLLPGRSQLHYGFSKDIETPEGDERHTVS